jgi:hypothetical protein
VLNFTCTVLACLSWYLGPGDITISDGTHFLYEGTRNSYFCTGHSYIYNCERLQHAAVPSIAN